MKLTLSEALEAITRDGSTEAYEKRMKRIRRLANERDSLIDGIEVLKDDTEPRYVAKREKMQKRLDTVLRKIEELR